MPFDAALREKVEGMLGEMRALYARGHTPRVKPSKSCNACSLKEICLPRLQSVPAASGYLKAHLEEAT